MVFTNSEIAYLDGQRLGRLATAQPVAPWRVRCLEIRGTAEALAELEVPLIRIHPRRIISFGIDEPETAAHELTSNNRNVG